MEKSIRQHAASGVLWGAVGQLGTQTFNFILSIILARLLFPEEFGLLAMISIFIAIAEVFINSGLGAAIIRKKDATPQDCSTVFYFNIAVSALFYVILFFSAPLVSAFFNEPILVNLTRLISIVFILNAFGVVQNALLAKELNFKKIKLIELSSLAISVLPTIYLAYHGYGVYSLVAQRLVQSFFKSMFLWVFSKWKPRDGFSVKSFKSLFAFGSKILLTGIFNIIFTNIDSILIGKIFLAQQLGFYSKAKATKDLPVNTLSNILTLPVYSIMAKIHDDHEALRRLNIKFYKVFSFVFFPIVFGLIAVAEPLIITMYTEKWAFSIPMLRILAFTAIPFLLGYIQDQTIIAKGLSGLYMKLSIINRVINVVTIPIGIFWGLFPFLWSITIVSLIGLFISNHYTGRLINVKFFDYVKIMFPYFGMSLLMFGVVSLWELIPFVKQYIKLFVQSGTGLGVYLGIAYLFKVEELEYVKTIILGRLKFEKK
ncbi:MAG: lipopolysaccharide biosynthesis protein [Bacteroidales bacterium]|nr:lipopolysaccharide biosynthesis protein [Bacteroidales bacterium]